MPETLHPGVYVREEAGIPRIAGVSVSTGGFVGFTERGRTDEAIFCASYSEFRNKCGGFLSGSYVPDAVKSFFDNGGARCYIGRVCGTGAVKATKSLDALSDLTTDLLKVDALGEGVYGNNLAVQCLKAGTTLSAILPSSSGWANIVVSVGVNDKIDFKEADLGAELTATIAPATYSTGTAFAAAIKAALDAAGSETYTVTWSATLHTITVATSGTFLSILFSTGTNAAISARTIMGFGSTDRTGALTYTGSALYVDTPATTCVVAATSGLELGDVLLISGTLKYRAIIQSIDFSTKTITFATPVTITDALPVGTPVYTASQHRARTTLSANLVTGAVQAAVTNGSRFAKGQVVTFSDGTTLGTVVLTGVNGNTLQFASLTLGSTIVAASSLVVSQEWKLSVYDNSILRETHDYLSSADTNDADYVEKRLAGDGNESQLVSADDLAPAVDHPYRVPYAVVMTALASGVDGSAPSDAQYAAGLNLFDPLTDINMASVPGVTTQSVLTDLVDYVENRGDMIAILDAPLTVDTTEEAREWKQITLNKDSSFYAAYYPWVQVRDPFASTGQTNRRRNVPPSGFLQGVYADVAATRGVHKAPANVPLRGALGLTVQVSDTDQDVLNPIGLNCIRVFPGEGIRVFGARTGYSVTDGKHYVSTRRLLNFTKESVARGIRWALFEPMNTELYSRLTLEISEFLRSMWKDGMLYPSDDVSQAYFVKCNEENNTDADRLAGRLNIALGIQPPYPAEFIVLSVSIYDGGTRFEEISGAVA